MAGPSSGDVTVGTINNMIIGNTTRAITGTAIIGDNLTVNTNLK